MEVDSPDLLTVIRNVRGEFQLANGNLDAHGLRADLLGGRLTATATMQHLDTSPVSKVNDLAGALAGAAKQHSEPQISIRFRLKDNRWHRRCSLVAMCRMLRSFRSRNSGHSGQRGCRVGSHSYRWLVFT